MDNKIRVRFAPSPTGYLHVGGLRTALYNYLYAKKMNGTFVLRIEDTDQTRFVEGAAEKLLEALKSTGLNYTEGPDLPGDFGPYTQSQRLEMYNKFAQQLVDNGQAYHCFCSAERLNELREYQKENKLDPRYDKKCLSLTKEEVDAKIAAGEPYVIRLNIPDEGEITFEDAVRGKVTIGLKEVDDQVLVKSDGFPTYHLANVVDDHHMQISHVIRGEEWLPSTPKHIFMYNAFGWEMPTFAHLPLLLNADRSKLSKRQNDVDVESYLAKGYLPEALINFIALMGWNNGDDQEIFTMEELENLFSLNRISKAGAIFNIEKLNWMNGMYIRSMSNEDLLKKVKPFIHDIVINDDALLAILGIAKERMTLLPDISEQIKPFIGDLEFAEEDKELLVTESAKTLFAFWEKEIAAVEDVSLELVKSLMKRSGKELGIKGKNLYPPLRLAFYGTQHGPDVGEIIMVLGKEKTLRRLQRLI